MVDRSQSDDPIERGTAPTPWTFSALHVFGYYMIGGPPEPGSMVWMSEPAKTEEEVTAALDGFLALQPN
jgi:hypothetical protein